MGVHARVFVHACPSARVDVDEGSCTSASAHECAGKGARTREGVRESACTSVCARESVHGCAFVSLHARALASVRARASVRVRVRVYKSVRAPVGLHERACA